MIIFTGALLDHIPTHPVAIEKTQCTGERIDDDSIMVLALQFTNAIPSEHTVVLQRNSILRRASVYLADLSCGVSKLRGV